MQNQTTMTILIAEDDTHIREGLRDMLEIEGYHVITAANGIEALRHYQTSQANTSASNQPIDFIILDIMMPQLDGYSVCKKIRAENSTIPILFLSAKSEEIDKVLGLELGADDYISKPFGIAEVRARIRAVARRCLASRQQATNSSFSFGDLTVIPDELRAKRGDQTFDLSPREIKIIECLKAHQGKVTTRDLLFDEVWGLDHIPNSRTLDQHISKLRKHIEIDPHNPQLILTVHGQGYRHQG